MRSSVTARARLLAMVVAGGLTLAACGSSAGSGGSAASGADAGDAGTSVELGLVGDQQAGEPVEGGTLTVADYSEPRSLNPAEVISTAYSGGTATAAVYDVLVRFDPESEQFEPWLAESIESNEDFTTWTVGLRDGVTFSDGTELDADAVVNSVNWYLASQGFDAAMLAPNLEQVRAEDDRTVVFELNKPWATFPAMLGQGIGMVVAPAATKGEFRPIGAGPFELDSYAPQEELVLSARDDYWGQGPYLDELRFVWLAGDDTKLDSLRSGGVDLAVMREQGAITEARADGLPGYAALTSLGSMVMLNQAEGRPAGDERVRQAIAHAVDPEVVYQRAFDGAGLPSKALFQEASRWHAEDVEPRAYDPAQARELLEAAKADGFDGSVELLAGADPATRTAAMTLKAMLESAGFTVEVELLRTIADRVNRMFVERDYDLAVGALSVSEEDPFQRLYSSFSSQAPSNALAYTDPEMDQLIGELQQTAGDERAAVIADIERRFQETVPVLPLGPSLTFSPWSERVHGVVPANEQMLLFGQAWLEQ